MTQERHDTATPLVDALETLRMGADHPEYPEAFAYVYAAIQDKRDKVLWSYPSEVREEASWRTLKKLLRRRQPLRSPVELVAHKYVNTVMRREAATIVKPPPPPRPPASRPVPPRRGAFDGLRADEADLEAFFSRVVPAVLELYSRADSAECRHGLLSGENLGQTLDDLRVIALGHGSAAAVGPDREAYRRQCQRAMVVLRAFVPRVWLQRHWCPEAAIWPKGSLKALVQAFRRADHAAMHPDIGRSLRAMVSLSEAFHVDRRGRAASGG